MALRKPMIVVFVAVLAGCVPVRICAGENRLVAAIFVVVNGTQITKDEVAECGKYLIERDYKGEIPADPEEREKVSRAALRELVTAQLLLDEGKLLELTVDDERVDKRLARSRMKPKEITRIVRRILKAQLMFDEIMRHEQIPPFQARPKDILNEYKKTREQFRQHSMVKVRHLFLPADNPKSIKAKKLQGNLFKKKIEAKPMAERTEFFSALAVEFSQDRCAENGGLLRFSSEGTGWFPQEMSFKDRKGRLLFPKAMIRGISGLSKKGEVKGPIVSEQGIHLLYLEDIKGGKYISKREAYKIIEHLMMLHERQKRLRKWLGDKYERSQVAWHDGSPYEKELLLLTEK